MPYLTFHHFDPTWRERKHHEAPGMVALCSNHAAKADGGYYPNEYFQKLKREGRDRAKDVQGKFDFLRRDLLVVVGSGIYYNVKTIVEINGERCVYFNRDDDGYLLFNFKMPTGYGQPRAEMEDNVWTVSPDAHSVECPPRGRFLQVHFDNGDMFRMRFVDARSMADLLSRFPDGRLLDLNNRFNFPLTVVELWEQSGNGLIEFGRRNTTLQGNNTFTNVMMVDCGVGISLKVPSNGLFGAGRISEDTGETLRRALASSPFGRHPRQQDGASDPHPK